MRGAGVTRPRLERWGARTPDKGHPKTSSRDARLTRNGAWKKGTSSSYSFRSHSALATPAQHEKSKKHPHL